MRLRPALATLLALLALPAPAALAAPSVELAPAAAARKADAGIVMMIHGGAWTGVGDFWVDTIRWEAARVRAYGYRTAIVDYAPGHLALADVTKAYDRLRRRAPGKRVCVVGESAGGHLALMLALRRRSVRCVVAIAPVTDIGALGGLGPVAADVLSHALSIFGESALTTWSPAQRASRIRAPLLVAGAANDAYVPAPQLWAMSDAPRARIAELAAGNDVEFGHGLVSAAAYAQYKRVERSFLRRHMRR